MIRRHFIDALHKK